MSAHRRSEIEAQQHLVGEQVGTIVRLLEEVREAERDIARRRRHGSCTGFRLSEMKQS
jgi:hypothetical protein